jgi:hypothetical protein
MIAHNTAKLGGAASDIVVAKVAVRYLSLLLRAPLRINSQLPLVRDSMGS